jgi:hypothetical protein
MKKVLRRIFEPERLEIAEGDYLCSLPNTNCDIKSRRTRCGEGHTSSLAEMREAHILFGKPERKTQLL